MRTASAHGLHDVSGGHQHTAPTAISPGPDSRIRAAVFSAQLVQTPARSIPQPVQLQLDL
jgi:hypothetical protein